MLSPKVLFTLVAIALAVIAGEVWLYAQPKLAMPAPINTVQTPQSPQKQTPRPLVTRPQTATVPPSVGTPSTTPAFIVVNTPTTVTVSALVTGGGLVPSSVNLLRLGTTGTQPIILGVMHDAGAGVYTLQTTFNKAIAGQIQLQVSAAFLGELHRALSSQSTIRVWSSFVDTNTNTQLALPPLGTSTAVITEATSPSRTALSIQVQSATVLGVTIYDVAAGNTLQAWFASNVDVNGILINTGTFRQTTLPDGLTALILSSSVPSSYLAVGGPVDSIYVISPTGDRVVAITPGQESQPADFGFDNTQTMIDIASTLVFR